MTVTTCNHCKKSIDLQQCDELLTAELYDIFICNQCGFPTPCIRNKK